MNSKKKVAVIGNGAVGMFIASVLSNNENIEIYLCSRRNKAVNNINNNGIRIHKADKSIYTNKITSILTKEIPSDINIIILCVKTTQIDDMLNSIPDKSVFDATIISLMNGMGYHDKIISRLKLKQLFCGIISYGIIKLDDVNIRLAGEGKIIIGKYYNHIDNRDCTRLDLIDEILSKVNIKYSLVDNILDYMWKKLCINACINPITAITGKSNGELYKTYEYLKLMDKLCDEILKVAISNGIKADKDNYKNEIIEVIKSTRDNRSSMLQDIDNNRETEIESINGYIVESGKKNNISVDINNIIYLLVKIIQS